MTFAQSLLHPLFNALKEQRTLIFKGKEAVKSGNYD